MRRMTLKTMVMILMIEVDSLDLKRALINSVKTAGPGQCWLFAKMISA